MGKEKKTKTINVKHPENLIFQLYYLYKQQGSSLLILDIYRICGCCIGESKILEIFIPFCALTSFVLFFLSFIQLSLLYSLFYPRDICIYKNYGVEITFV